MSIWLVIVRTLEGLQVPTANCINCKFELFFQSEPFLWCILPGDVVTLSCPIFFDFPLSYTLESR